MKKLQLGMKSRCNIGAMIKEARIAFDKALGIPVDLTLPQKNFSEEKNYTQNGGLNRKNKKNGL